MEQLQTVQAGVQYTKELMAECCFVSLVAQQMIYPHTILLDLVNGGTYLFC